MNYQEIVKALPTDVATILQSELDNVDLADSLSREEVQELAEDAVKMTKLKMVIEDEEKRRMVDSLLSSVGPAVVRVLFA